MACLYVFGSLLFSFRAIRSKRYHYCYFYVIFTAISIMSFIFDRYQYI